MFDTLLCIFALGNAAIEAKAWKVANSTNKNYEFYNQFEANAPKEIMTPCFEEESIDEEKKADRFTKSPREPLAIRQSEYKELLKKRELNNHRKSAPTTEQNDPVINWVFNHQELMIDILNNPGIHLIKKEEYAGLDDSALADFLFQRNQIETVIIVEDGLEVTSR